jgi:DNA mismatch repair ATPase MutS
MGLLASGRQFMPNSVDMSESSNMHIITGPNMAGKSTLLRQNALTVILAQVGSFVPADSARIGVVDKLFSRIGARDDLFRDRSTFMVEMLETADILRRASEKSLVSNAGVIRLKFMLNVLQVIMDEVGRGTTVNDGLAISFATLHHLATVNRSRCFFATHFHEVAEMVGNKDGQRGSGIFDRVRFYCSDIDESDVSWSSCMLALLLKLWDRINTSRMHIACALVLTVIVMVYEWRVLLEFRQLLWT